MYLWATKPNQNRTKNQTHHRTIMKEQTKISCYLQVIYIIILPTMIGFYALTAVFALLKVFLTQKSIRTISFSIHVYVMRNTLTFHISKIINTIYIFFFQISSEDLKMVQNGTERQVSMCVKIQVIWNILVFPNINQWEKYLMLAWSPHHPPQEG